MQDTSLCQELFAAIPDIKSIRAESFFSLIAAANVSALTAKNEGCIFLPYLNVCYNGVPNSKHLHIILVIEVMMTCGFAFPLLLVPCEVLGLTFQILHTVCAKNTSFCWRMCFSPF